MEETKRDIRKVWSLRLKESVIQSLAKKPDSRKRVESFCEDLVKNSVL